MRGPAVLFLDVGDIADECAVLAKRGCRLFRLGAPATSAAFLERARAVLPLDPPLSAPPPSGKVNWDAFADSLFGGLDALDDTRIAIVIDDATPFRRAAPREFEIALNCLSTAGRDVVAEKEADGASALQVQIVVGLDDEA